MARQRRGQKRIFIIAGPNGAGKTTFAREFLPAEGGCPDFINADLIAAGLSPFAPEKVAIQAGKMMLELIDEKFQAGESFAIETTLAGLTYLRHIARWRAAGYYVKLIFLCLPAAEIAIERVRSRVRQGGHNIPNEVVRRRFLAGLKNFHAEYSKVVSAWSLYDSYEKPPRLIAEGVNP